jgi:hypothetical protein
MTSQKTAATHRDPPITGIYEVCIGVSSADEMQAVCEYYREYGFGAPVNAGAISTSDALDLYGTNSKVTSVRLPHQNADHGLLRVMHWETPRSRGVGAGPLKRGVGSRWASALTRDVHNIAYHARQAQTFDGDVRSDLDVTSGIRKTTSDSM